MWKSLRETLNEMLEDPEFKAEWDKLSAEFQAIRTDDTQYYRLELDDYSTVSFCSFGKYYFGTLEEIRAFIDTLDKKCKSSHRELVAAFRAYEAGQVAATHHVAFQEVSLLMPAKLIYKEKAVLENHTWEHLNTWQCVYKMRCEKVETEHLWIECEGRGFRVLKASFRGLQHESVLRGWRDIHENMLWGFPYILQEDSGRFRNVLAEPEKGFETMEKLEQDWENFKNNPDPQFGGFCDDIFGDG